MSQVAISGNASGTGTLTIAAPNTNSNYTLTLPQATTTLVGTDATQTLTNKTIQGGAITSGTAVASTSGTSIDFTGIPSWCKRITVLFQDVSSNGTSNFLVQLGDSGGIENTGYLGAGNNNASISNYTTGFGTPLANASTAILQGAIVIQNITGNSWIASGSFSRSDFASAGVTAGSKTLSATLDRIRITTVGGTDTFDAGSVNIMYEG